MMDAPLRTERNREFFVDNGHKFVFEKLSKRDGSIGFWQCQFKNKDPCPTRIHVQGGIIIRRLNRHNHASSPTAIEATRIRNTIKRRAVENQEVIFFLTLTNLDNIFSYRAKL